MVFEKVRNYHKPRYLDMLFINFKKSFQVVLDLDKILCALSVNREKDKLWGIPDKNQMISLF